MQDLSKKIQRYKWFINFLLVLSTCLLIITIFKSKIDNRSICNSIECLQTAARLKLEMNNLKMINKEQSLLSLQEKINKTVENYLRHLPKSSDTYPIKIARNFYKACSDQEIREELGVEIIFKYLEEVGLPKLPSIFSQKNLENFDWTKQFAELQKKLGIDPFLDVKFVKSTEKDYFLLTTDTFTDIPRFSKFFDVDISDVNILKYKFKTTFKEIMSNLIIDDSTTLPENILNEANDILWNMTLLTSKIFFKANPDKSENVLYPLPKNSLWRRYLKSLFNNLKSGNFTDYDLFYYKNEATYITHISNVLSNTTNIVLEFFAWWKVVSTLISTTTRSAQDYLKSNSITREEDCADLTVQFVNPAIISGMLGKDSVKAKVQDLITNVKTSLQEGIAGAEWLDYFTKVQANRKIDELRYKICAPHWIFNEDEVMEIFQDVIIKSNAHLDNMVSIIRSSLRRKYEPLNHRKYHENWPKITDISLGYNSETNTIVVPCAVLAPPLYKLGLRSLEYGALGTMIAKELWFGYKNSDWWRINTTYIVKNNDENVLYDGFLPLPEFRSSVGNLLTDVSVRISFRAYKKETKYKILEEHLPGFEDISSDQLFFVGTIYSTEK